jgi:hypothetical protein
MRIIIFFLMLCMSGCTGPLALVGQIYGGADALTSLTTGKGATDTIISTSSNKDCRIHRLFKEEPVCKETNENIDIKEKKSNNVEVKKEKSILKNIVNLFKFK